MWTNTALSAFLVFVMNGIIIYQSLNKRGLLRISGNICEGVVSLESVICEMKHNGHETFLNTPLDIKDQWNWKGILERQAEKFFTNENGNGRFAAS